MRISDWGSDVCSSDLHRVDWLGGGAGGNDHATCGERFGLEETNQLAKQFRGLEHAAVAALSAGLVAAARSQNRGAIGGASSREGVGRYVERSVVAVSFKKTNTQIR